MKRVLVIIDNGHGEDTAGKQSPDCKLKEWQWTREIASRIQRELSREGINSVLLVPEKEDISLTERARRANKYSVGAEPLLVSIHVNAANNSYWNDACGWTGWVARVASEKSRKLAQLLYKEAEKASLQGDRYVPKKKYWEADYFILRKTSCPAVLTENLFMTNKDDVEYLCSELGKQTIVALHVNAIKQYIEWLNK